MKLINPQGVPPVEPPSNVEQEPIEPESSEDTTATTTIKNSDSNNRGHIKKKGSVGYKNQNWLIALIARWSMVCSISWLVSPFKAPMVSN